MGRVWRASGQSRNARDELLVTAHGGNRRRGTRYRASGVSERFQERERESRRASRRAVITVF